MKKALLALTFFGALFLTAKTASADVVIFYSNGEKLEVVSKLPADAVIDGSHVNLGVMYKQFAIFWIPMWNYGDVKYVLINDKKDTYYDLDEEVTIAMLKEEFDLNVPDVPTIGFWNKIGGKIIWGGLILLIIWGNIPNRKKNKDEEKDEEEAEKS
jgi:hypothetical protein